MPVPDVHVAVAHPGRLDPQDHFRTVRLRVGIVTRFERFAPFVQLSQDEVDAYWAAVSVPYRRYYAYEEVLAPFAERALLGQPPTESALLDAACRAYRLRHEDVAPLVAWCR